ncbi:MAG TPA: PadR family transcriptional regulator [Mycobacteriales bacterium]|nr:PadR family transcriptional regulator [Mycobacteriales bacterium]
MDLGERLRRGGFGRVPGFPPPPGFGPGGLPGGPGFGPGGPGRGRHRGRGARRGDVRAAVLALLAERPMHGYELIQQIEERSGGVWRPSPGSIYPTLQLLADEGLVSGDETGGRRLFTLTDGGREQAAQHEGQSPFTQERDETFEVAHQFRDELGQLGMAVWQVAQVGTDAQRTEILGVLAEARRRAYQLLADGGPAADAGSGPAGPGSGPAGSGSDPAE